MRLRLASAVLAPALLAAACSAPDAAAPLAPSGSAARALAGAGSACAFERSRGTMRLLGDCTTDRTIWIPDGVTLDGAGHTITAVDPAGDHFRGAVVENAGAAASVRSLTVTADGLANVCDAEDDRLAGIRLTDASGVVADNVVTGVVQMRADGQVSECQEGWSIWVRTRAWTGRAVDVSVVGNRVDRYQKEGIFAGGAVAATIERNEVRGSGPQRIQAQYGIEVTTSVPGTVRNNQVSDNVYVGPYPAWAGGINSDRSRRLTVVGNVVTRSSAGIQLFEADQADVIGNTVVGPAAPECPEWAPSGSCTFGVQIAGSGHIRGNEFRSLDVGIDVLPGSGRVKITGNRFEDVDTPVRRQ